MSNECNDNLFLELYKTRLEQFVIQGNRLWIRFHYFLTAEIALIGLFLVRGSDFTVQYLHLIPLLGIICSIIWYLIGAQDLYFYDGYRKAFNTIEAEVIAKLGNSIIPTKIHLSDIKGGLLRFRIKGIGVTSFTSICPILFLLLWGLAMFIH